MASSKKRPAAKLDRARDVDARRLEEARKAARKQAATHHEETPTRQPPEGEKTR